MSIIADLKVSLSASTGDLRKALTDVAKLADGAQSKVAEFSQRLNTLSSNGKRFQVPKGFPDGGRFADSTRALQIFETEVNGFMGNLRGMLNELHSATAAIGTFQTETQRLTPTIDAASNAETMFAARTQATLQQTLQLTTVTSQLSQA